MGDAGSGIALDRSGDESGMLRGVHALALKELWSTVEVVSTERCTRAATITRPLQIEIKPDFAFIRRAQVQCGEIELHYRS
jgi:hypothetical protein